MIRAIRHELLNPFVHAFFQRHGGVSIGPYCSLNCGIRSLDESTSVQENRARSSHYLGIDPKRLVVPFQTHSSHVHLVASKTQPSAPCRADALVTNLPRIALGVTTADCVPVLFGDESAGVIGVAHAGWRGSISRIAEKTIVAMETLGAERANTVAIIGPHICAQCYEVDFSFMDDICKQEPELRAHFFLPPGKLKPSLGLSSLLKSQLQTAGLHRVADVGQCTYCCSIDYFSRRFSLHNGYKAFGEHLSAIAIR